VGPQSEGTDTQINACMHVQIYLHTKQHITAHDHTTIYT